MPVNKDDTEGSLATSRLATAAAQLTLLAVPDVIRVMCWLLDAEPAARGRVTRCSEAVGLDEAAVARIYGRLTSSGLMTASDHVIELSLEVLRTSARDLDDLNPIVGRLDAFPAVRGLFSHGRLANIPAEPDMIQNLAQFLASLFQPGRTYRESEVNDVLRQVHDDFARLRRMMVDYSVLSRNGSANYQLVHNEPEGKCGGVEAY